MKTDITKLLPSHKQNKDDEYLVVAESSDDIVNNGNKPRNNKNQRDSKRLHARCTLG